MACPGSLGHHDHAYDGAIAVYTAYVFLGMRMWWLQRLSRTCPASAFAGMDAYMPPKQGKAGSIPYMRVIFAPYLQNPSRESP